MAQAVPQRQASRGRSVDGASSRRRIRRKVTLSLTPEALDYVDRKAAETGRNRSQLIDDAILAAERRETDELAIEGYRFFSKENVEMAEEGMAAFWEVVRDEPEWPDAPDRPRQTR